MDIVTALDAATGTTCVVGAGGKKTTMKTLADRLDRSIVTATVRIPIFDEWVDRVAVTPDPVGAVQSQIEREREDEWALGVVPEQEREDRYYGYDPEEIDRLSEFDLPVFVKADGARMRKFKAPDEHEPRLPRTADTVVSIASAHVVGEPLSEEIVHRVDEVVRLTGLEPGDEITAADVATVLASDEGGRKGLPDGTTMIPLLNMVDDESLEATAREIAAEIHERVDVPHVVLAEMRADEPLVDIV